MKKISRVCVPSTLLLVVAACGGAAPSPTTPPTRTFAPGAGGEVPIASAKAPTVGFLLKAESPLALTASDGTGLKLVELDASAVIDGPLAFTEMKLVFENPQDRTLEGTFRITLPQNASMGRFAMKISDAWQEGEVVELAAARRAYEDFLHRKQDPALMEKAAGNEFSARVFPIPARGRKEIIVSYASEIGEKPYTLPLRGLPALGTLTARATVAGAKKQPDAMTGRDITPSQDFVVDAQAFAPRDTAKVTGVSGNDLTILRVKPQEESKPDPITSAILLVDTSASRVLGFEEELSLVERLVKRVAEGNGSVTVACFDQSVAPIFEGKASAFGAGDIAKIRERGALGASDMGRALAWANDQAKKSGQKRLVLVTDGVATAGTADSKALATAASHLKDAGIERIDALAIGGIRDDATLGKLVRGSVAHDGVVAQIDAAGDAPAAMKRLGEATRSGLAVNVEGAKWFWPKKLDGVQGGDTYSIYVEGGGALKVSVDGKPSEQASVRKATAPLVERAVMQAKVTSMIDANPDDKAKKTITEIAVKNRLMTPYTAMLVLETEADYARYHIDRKSLADVLAINSGRVERLHRQSGPLFIESPPREVAMDEKKQEFGYDFSNDPSSSPPKPSASAGPRPTTTRPPPGNYPPEPAMKSVEHAPSPVMAPAPAAPPPPPPARAMRPRAEPREERPHADMASRADRDGDGVADKTNDQNPYEGRFASVMDKLKVGDKPGALDAAKSWHAEEPGDVLALVALGESCEAVGANETAARAYGSVVDLFPNRADLRRFAGERLERLGALGLDLATDTFEKAVKDRPDHPASHRLLAYSLVKKKEYAKAFDAIVKGAKQGYEVDRFRGVDRILAEDIGLIGAAWAKAEPARRTEILAKVTANGGKLESEPSLRFVLNWETDANDVDFHIHDARGGHAFYSQPELNSGGKLYADVTTGYGPECFTIRNDKKARAAPYKLEAHYYSRGPMGYGMGKLEIIEHDGKGGLTIEERPFIVMTDGAFVDLGTVK